MTLTLQEIRDHIPCQSGWKKLTKAVGNDMTTKLSIGDVIISNGLDDALWCLRCLDPRKRVAAIIPAVKRASVSTDDQRVHDCVNDIEKWLAGDNSINLSAVEDAAWAAAWAAGPAGRAVAWAAERTLADNINAGAEACDLQKSDLLKMFPPMILKGQNNG